VDLSLFSSPDLPIDEIYSNYIVNPLKSNSFMTNPSGQGFPGFPVRLLFAGNAALRRASAHVAVLCRAKDHGHLSDMAHVADLNW